jgi:hypothetical protein
VREVIDRDHAQLLAAADRDLKFKPRATPSQPTVGE